MARKRKLNAYRDGKVHVCRRLCDTCIFKPEFREIIGEERVSQMISESTEKQSAIICHSTLSGDNAVCRGFYEKHPTAPLAMAGKLGLLVEVEPPKKD